MGRVTAPPAAGHVRPSERRTAASRSSRYRSLAPYWIAVAVSWALLGLASASAVDDLHHAAMPTDGNALVGLTIALSAWTVMVVAMMLPSTLPMLGLFRTAANAQEHPSQAVCSFAAGYLAVWLAFGTVAVAASVALHAARNAAPWLDGHWWLAVAALVAVAGAFQFSSLRKRCLHVCRHPFAFLMHRYRPGRRGAFRIGAEHGRFCLGCCWALMFLMAAVGLTSLVWMGIFTAVMVYEKVGRRGELVARAAGAALVTAALVIFVVGATSSEPPGPTVSTQEHSHDHIHPGGA